MPHPLNNLYSSMPSAELIPIGTDRLPIVDQALELAERMETHNTSEEIAIVLRAAARVFDEATTTAFLVSTSDSQDKIN